MKDQINRDDFNELVIRMIMNRFFTTNVKGKKVEAVDIQILKDFCMEKNLPWLDELPF